MPTYEYRCEKCEDTVERTQSIHEDIQPELDCGLCGGVMRRTWGFNAKRSGQEMPPGSR